MKAKNALGHYNKKKEAAENPVKRKHVWPVLLCLLLAIVIWLLVCNNPDTDYRKNSFYQLTHKETTSGQTQTE